MIIKVNLLFSISRRNGTGRNEERGGCRKSTRTEVNIAAVADLVKNDCQIKPRMIAEALNIPKSVALQILKVDLGKRKLYMFCSTLLTPEQREDRVTSCQDIIAMLMLGAGGGRGCGGLITSLTNSIMHCLP